MEQTSADSAFVFFSEQHLATVQHKESLFANTGDRSHLASFPTTIALGVTLLTIHSLSHSIPPISLSPVAINILFTVFRSLALFGQIYLRVLYIFVIFLSLLDWRGRVRRLGPDLAVL